jgi:hypothetical protein
MRDLRIRCNSGDLDYLTFTAENYRDDSPIDVIIRDMDGASILWLSQAQALRLSDWLKEAFGKQPEGPEEI